MEEGRGLIQPSCQARLTDESPFDAVVWIVSSSARKYQTVSTGRPGPHPDVVESDWSESGNTEVDRHVPVPGIVTCVCNTCSMYVPVVLFISGAWLCDGGNWFAH